MNLISSAIQRPVAVIAVVLMVLLFGLVALQTIPIQLTPDVRKPIISLRTNWLGAAPAEIEREIINRQEEVLKGIEGLENIISDSQDGRGSIKLEFKIGQNMERALLLVANRLDRVNGYPAEASEPTMRTSSSDDNAIAWFVLIRTKSQQKEMHSFGEFAEDIIQDRLERIPGVSRINVYGGSSKQLEVLVDPDSMARFSLTISEVVRKIRAANASISAGNLDEGKRRYIVRTEGTFSQPEDIKSILLRSNIELSTGRVARVTVGDIGKVQFSNKEPTSRIRYNGQPAMALNAIRENGANVIEVMGGIRNAVKLLNSGVLADKKLTLHQVYDETVYINSSINLVQNNIFLGGALAALMLLIFLRSGGATLIVSLAIPVSVIGAFVAMAAMGRSINVISLAGIAFAVGMVVDAAIVVLENIFRFRERGFAPRDAAYQGATQVWGAILVSALTTVMVFIPILVMELEMGQLFRDIAVALSVSVLLSLLVAITVIPALANRLLGNDNDIKKVSFRLPVIDALAERFVNSVLNFTSKIIKSPFKSLAVVSMLFSAGIVSTYWFLPKLDYLPNGNRNLIIGFLVPPPGYNLKTTGQIAAEFENEIKPLLGGVDFDKTPSKSSPKLSRFFFVAFRGRTIVGAAAQDPNRVGELIPILRRAVYKEPGTFGFVNQRSLFGRGIGGKRAIDFNISGSDLEQILEVAQRSADKIWLVMPRKIGTQIRPKPGLELGAPEIRVKPNQTKLADNGLTAKELGDTLDAFNDGLRIDQITIGSKRIDLMLKGLNPEKRLTQGIAQIPVVNSSGQIVMAGELAEILVTSGPTEIRHIDRERTVTLQIGPPEQMPLELALENLQTQVIDKLKSEGLPEGIRLTMTGAADALQQTWDAILLDLLVALIIVYLVMAVLFENFIYPLIIMVSVPLATAGGVFGLAVLNLYRFQPLDMLTMLGFVILIGIVVNNAILLVHQTLHHIRNERMNPHDAVLEATRNRIRPIFMSTLTSVFGMLPLVLIPGSGSELYRGLGSVVIGGLSLSAILTLAIVPPLLGIITSLLEKPSPLMPQNHKHQIIE